MNRIACRLRTPSLWRAALAAAGLAAAMALAPIAASGKSPQRLLAHTGIQDASAGIAISRELFVAGDDEQNVLNVYRRDEAGPPLASFDLNEFVQPDPRHPEMDVEGVTRLVDGPRGDVYFWITSHGANASGKRRPSRHALFATRFRVQGETVAIEYVGKPYKGLLGALESDKRYADFHVDAASRLPPKAQGGFNIEGLAATPDGQLLIGFRSPTVHGKALIALVTNPLEIIDGKPIQLGDPRLVDLGGLGIRSFEYWPKRRTYVLAAGPRSKGECRLFTWSGKAGEEARMVEHVSFKHFSPEALIIYPDSDEVGVQLLSDDGRTSGNRSSTGDARVFRSGWIQLGEPNESPASDAP